MSKAISQKDLHWLEDVLATSGIFCFCRDTELDVIRYNYRTEQEELEGNPAITAVVTSWEDAGLMQQILRKNRDEIIGKFGNDVVIRHQFWPYFLSYLEMGRISSDLPERFFISTTIKGPTEVGAPYRYLAFDLEMVLVKGVATTEEKSEMRSKISQHINELNQRSRYLRIKSVKTGYARSKFVFSGEPEITYEPLDIFN